MALFKKIRKNRASFIFSYCVKMVFSSFLPNETPLFRYRSFHPFMCLCHKKVSVPPCKWWWFVTCQLDPHDQRGLFSAEIPFRLVENRIKSHAQPEAHTTNNHLIGGTAITPFHSLSWEHDNIYPFWVVCIKYISFVNNNKWFFFLKKEEHIWGE